MSFSPLSRKFEKSPLHTALEFSCACIYFFLAEYGESISLESRYFAPSRTFVFADVDTMREVFLDVFELLWSHLCQTYDIWVFSLDDLGEFLDVLIAHLVSEIGVPISQGEVASLTSSYTSEVITIQVQDFHTFMLFYWGLRVFFYSTRWQMILIPSLMRCG